MNNLSVSDVENSIARFNTAMIERDTETLNALTAEALSYGHSKGKIEDQAAFLKNIKNDEATQFSSITISDQTITLFHDNAIVRHTFNAATSKKGVAGELSVKNLLVWKCIEGQWKLIARQAFSA